MKLFGAHFTCLRISLKMILQDRNLHNGLIASQDEGIETKEAMLFEWTKRLVFGATRSCTDCEVPPPLCFWEIYVLPGTCAVVSSVAQWCVSRCHAAVYVYNGRGGGNVLQTDFHKNKSSEILQGALFSCPGSTDTQLSQQESDLFASRCATP